MCLIVHSTKGDSYKKNPLKNNKGRSELRSR